ncbi:MAG: TerB family tellurite resistance protein [Bacteriovoracia bacterium]
MSLFKKLVGISYDLDSDPDYSEALEKMKALFSTHEEKTSQFYAAFSFLLARVANTDSNVTDAEKVAIRDILINQCGLSTQLAEAIQSLAVEKTVSNKVENHIIVRKLNEVASRDQKYMVIRSLLMVAKDEDITEQESEQIALIASGLMLSRKEFIQIRSEFREYLRVLKNLPK